MWKKTLIILGIVSICVAFFSTSDVYAEEKSYEKISDLNNKGSLLIVGGNLDPANDEINEKLVSLAQKRRGVSKSKVKIAIIPAPSSSPSQTGRFYKEDFINHNGILPKNIKVFPIAVVDDRTTPNIDESTWQKNAFGKQGKKLAQELLAYDAVVFPGGDQLRIKMTLQSEVGDDSPVLKALRTIYKDGGVIAGSSAGAAMMSNPMLARGHNIGGLKSGATYELQTKAIQDRVWQDKRLYLTKGMGFLKQGLVDTHFLKRGRLGRLIVACLDYNFRYGFGLAENTALIVKNNEVDIAGESGVMIFDLSEVNYNWTEEGLKAQQIKVNYLERGDSFNFATGEVNVDKRRKRITKAIYNPQKEINGIFNPGIAKKILTKYLVDNKQKEVVGLGYSKGAEKGFKFIFEEKKSTQGFKGNLVQPEYYPKSEKLSYTVKNAYLNIKPSTREIPLVRFNKQMIEGENNLSIGVEAEEIIIGFSPNIKYEGISNWTLSVEGKLEKNRDYYDEDLDEIENQAIVFTDNNEVKTDVGIVFKADYEKEIAESIYIGSYNNLEWEKLENKKRYYKDPYSSDYNKPEVVLSTEPYLDLYGHGLKISNQIEIIKNYYGYNENKKRLLNTIYFDYETSLDNNTYFGFKSSYEIEKTNLDKLSDFDSSVGEKTFIIEPYLDFVVKGWKLGMIGEYEVDETLDQEKYNDTEAEDIILTPYLDYEQEHGALLWGVKSDYELTQENIKYTNEFNEKILSITPYIDVFNLDVTNDISLDIYSEVELQKSFQQDLALDFLFKSKAFYKNYRFGVNAVVKQSEYDNDEDERDIYDGDEDRGWGVKTFIAYRYNLAHNSELTLKSSYKLVDKDNYKEEDIFSLSGLLNYKF